VRCFGEDLTATQTARLTGLSIRSVNSIFLKIRRRLAEECEAQSPYSGVVEVDESYFGPQRARGKKGRGAGGKTAVVGVFQRGDNVYTQIVPNCAKPTLQKVIRGRVSRESVIQSDGWSGYDGLVDVGYKKHVRVKHSKNQFAERSNHINGIEAKKKAGRQQTVDTREHDHGKEMPQPDDVEGRQRQKGQQDDVDYEPDGSSSSVFGSSMSGSSVFGPSPPSSPSTR